MLKLNALIKKFCFPIMVSSVIIFVLLEENTPTDRAITTVAAMPLSPPLIATNAQLPEQKASTPLITTPQITGAVATHISEAAPSLWQIGRDDSGRDPSLPLADGVVLYTPVSLPSALNIPPLAGTTINLPLLDGEMLAANVESVTTHENGDVSWSGHLDGFGDSYPVVMTYGEHLVVATITTPAGSYTLESVDGLGWLYKNPSEFELSAAGAHDFLEVPNAY
jgi:hypothetical protein